MSSAPFEWAVWRGLTDSERAACFQHEDYGSALERLVAAEADIDRLRTYAVGCIPGVGCEPDHPSDEPHHWPAGFREALAEVQAEADHLRAIVDYAEANERWLSKDVIREMGPAQRPVGLTSHTITSRTELNAKLDAVLKLHRQVVGYRPCYSECREDGIAWPCPTVAAIRDAGSA